MMMNNNENDNDFYKRIKGKLDSEAEQGGNHFVDNLDEFERDYKALYDDIIEELIGYAARLARQAQMTISLLLSSFEIRLCLEEETKSIKLSNNPLGVNPFVLYVNVNYWLSLGNVNTNFDKKSAIFKERITSFYLLHLLLSKDKEPKLWSLCSELETNQYMSNDDLYELDPWTVDDVSRMLNIELPKEASATQYYELLKKDIESKEQQGDNELEGFKQALNDSKHNDTRFEPSISTAFDESDMKDNISKILQSVEDVINMSEDSTQDKSWGNFSSKVHSVLEALKPPVPLADYKTMLRGVVGRVKGSHRLSYRRPNRYKDYIAKGRVKASNEPHVLVAIDVSGSVRDKEIIEALGEICHIKQGKITVMQFDSALVSLDTYTQKQWTSMLRKGYVLHGRGGTNFEIPMQEFETNFFSRNNPKGYSFMIVFTDGYCTSVLPRLANGDVNLVASKKIRWMITKEGTASYLKGEYPNDAVLYLHNSTYNKDKNK